MYIHICIHTYVYTHVKKYKCLYMYIHIYRICAYTVDFPSCLISGEYINHTPMATPFLGTPGHSHMTRQLFSGHRLGRTEAKLRKKNMTQNCDLFLKHPEAVENDVTVKICTVYIML